MEWYLKVLKQYGDFSGRARRKEYWMFALFNLIIGFFLGLFEGFSGLFPNTSESVFGQIYSLAVFIPSLAVAVRRMHDVGKSGWFSLLWIFPIPLLGWVWLIPLLLKPSYRARETDV